MHFPPTADVLPNPVEDAVPLVPRTATPGRVSVRPPSAAPPSKPSDDPDAPRLIDVSAWFRESPPWLISAIVHMVLLICVGLWVVKDEIQFGISLEGSYGEDIDPTPLDDMDLAVETDLQADDQALTPQTLPPVEDPFAAPPQLEIDPNASFATVDRSSPSIGVALSGREPGMKKVLGLIYGSTAGTQNALSEGLKWLAKQQLKPGPKTGPNAGLWSLQGPYRDGANVENVEAATAMALIAFQGDGHTHKSGAYAPVVAKAWNALLRRQNEDGRFFNNVMDQHQLYTQALCTIAICELYGMTKDEAYRKPAQRAVDYCVRIQASEGGWKYTPGQLSDMSVTGWFVMALQSARMAGLEVPSDVFIRIEEFLETVSRENGSRYAYMERDGPKLALTAEGLLCRQYLGWQRDDSRLRDGVDYLLNNLPDWRYEERNVYYWYYGTQVCHHMEGADWRVWNDVIKEMLPEHQESRGAERGSWDPDGDRWGSAGGRLYVTCLSLYILEVYHRHLPIYQQGLLGK